MGKYADMEIDRWIGDCQWGSRRRRDFVPVPVKQKNSKVFAAYAGRGDAKFKTGDRVVHMPSGVAGEVIAVRGETQTLWKPDTRLKPGAVWVDTDKLRFDI